MIKKDLGPMPEQDRETQLSLSDQERSLWGDDFWRGYLTYKKELALLAFGIAKSFLE